MHALKDEQSIEDESNPWCSSENLPQGNAFLFDSEVEAEIPSNVIEVEFGEARSESCCENGVCGLSWKPKRVA